MMSFLFWALILKIILNTVSQYFKRIPGIIWLTMSPGMSYGMSHLKILLSKRLLASNKSVKNKTNMWVYKVCGSHTSLSLFLKRCCLLYIYIWLGLYMVYIYGLGPIKALLITRLGFEKHAVFLWFGSKYKVTGQLLHLNVMPRACCFCNLWHAVSENEPCCTKPLDRNVRQQQLWENICIRHKREETAGILGHCQVFLSSSSSSFSLIKPDLIQGSDQEAKNHSTLYTLLTHLFHSKWD